MLAPVLDIWRRYRDLILNIDVVKLTGFGIRERKLNFGVFLFVLPGPS